MDVVFVGSGHAHLTALAHLMRYIGKGAQVTVVSPGEHLYYSGMGPGMLSGMYQPQESRFNIKKLTESRGAMFMDDTVVRVDPLSRVLHLAGGQAVNYDLASFGIGSVIDTGPIDTSYENVFKAKPVARLLTLRNKLIHSLETETRPVRLVVVGGGATGVEVSGNGFRIAADMNKDINITLVSRGPVLTRFPGTVRKSVLKRLGRRGIRVIENMPVKGNSEGKFLLEDGNELPFDFAVIATGTRPPSLFKDSGIPTGPKGGLLVNDFLQSPRYPELLGGGDCIFFEPLPLERVGVFAVRQNTLLMENMEAAMLGENLKPFIPNLAYLLILNMGDGTGVFNRKFITFGGAFALKLKDYIDRKFMDKFQLSGELDE